MSRTIYEGAMYKHFKGKLYVVDYIATHIETGEKYVVYHILNEKHEYVRPYNMFASEVDHDKYPDVEQKWRFAFA